MNWMEAAKAGLYPTPPSPEFLTALKRDAEPFSYVNLVKDLATPVPGESLEDAMDRLSNAELDYTLQPLIAELIDYQWRFMALGIVKPLDWMNQMEYAASGQREHPAGMIPMMPKTQACFVQLIESLDLAGYTILEDVVLAYQYTLAITTDLTSGQKTVQTMSGSDTQMLGTNQNEFLRIVKDHKTPQQSRTLAMYYARILGVGIPAVILRTLKQLSGGQVRQAIAEARKEAREKHPLMTPQERRNILDACRDGLGVDARDKEPSCIAYPTIVYPDHLSHALQDLNDDLFMRQNPEGRSDADVWKAYLHRDRLTYDDSYHKYMHGRAVNLWNKMKASIVSRCQITLNNMLMRWSPHVNPDAARAASCPCRSC